MSETGPDFIPFIPSRLPDPFHLNQHAINRYKKRTNGKSSAIWPRFKSNPEPGDLRNCLVCHTAHGHPSVSGQLYCVERNAIPLDQAAPGKG